MSPWRSLAPGEVCSFWQEGSRAWSWRGCWFHYSRADGTVNPRARWQDLLPFPPLVPLPRGTLPSRVNPVKIPWKTGGLFTVSYTHLVRKIDGVLLEGVNAALEALSAEGYLDDLGKKWFGRS